MTSRSGDDRLVRRLEGDNLHEADLCSHGLGPGAQPCHAQMAAAITEFQAFLAQGMGVGAHHGLAEAGIRLVSAGTAPALTKRSRLTWKADWWTTGSACTARSLSANATGKR